MMFGEPAVVRVMNMHFRPRPVAAPLLQRGVYPGLMASALIPTVFEDWWGTIKVEGMLWCI